jgi:hypothetical protein
MVCAVFTAASGDGPRQVTSSWPEEESTGAGSSTDSGSSIEVGS